MVELIKFVEKEHAKRVKIGEDIANLYKGELNPVASKAQRRVPIPEGLVIILKFFKSKIILIKHF